MKTSPIVYGANADTESVPAIVISRELYFATKIDLRRLGYGTLPLVPHPLLFNLCLPTGCRSL